MHTTTHNFAKLLLLILLMQSCQDGKQPQPVITGSTATKSIVTPGGFVHAVYFWLAAPDDTTANEQFEKSLLNFVSSSPDITTYHLGRPASTNRPIIDTTYTYCLLVTFDSKADHDLYQEDVAHKQFIKESEHLWTRVQIYDSESVLE